MKAPTDHPHPHDPDDIVHGAALEPGDVVRAGDVYAFHIHWFRTASPGHVVAMHDIPYIRPVARTAVAA